ncbi:hypothetical protein K437DRAFT_179546 [Tilletiaria anomala UBC 951]|uniref:Secreted protein n=1 Tax=Tilletiaria anomala (strain ATCC 24038 / CBS 436.72 / UBC 951) TaxID=1037660 RepID=A0A066VLG5_TILAU|nr:uncharacterized protein K437DRAFT_179546 [Tilletiaria anomala UBC 951]KDN41138.1 hypothetical protein K437DRAFT_179546 [Tilletiaria anomala UBC 951]
MPLSGILWTVLRSITLIVWWLALSCVPANITGLKGDVQPAIYDGERERSVVPKPDVNIVAKLRAFCYFTGLGSLACQAWALSHPSCSVVRPPDFLLSAICCLIGAHCRVIRAYLTNEVL